MVRFRHLKFISIAWAVFLSLGVNLLTAGRWLPGISFVLLTFLVFRFSIVLSKIAEAAKIEAERDGKRSTDIDLGNLFDVKRHQPLHKEKYDNAFRPVVILLVVSVASAALDSRLLALFKRETGSPNDSPRPVVSDLELLEIRGLNTDSTRVGIRGEGRLSVYRISGIDLDPNVASSSEPLFQGLLEGKRELLLSFQPQVEGFTTYHFLLQPEGDEEIATGHEAFVVYEDTESPAPVAALTCIFEDGYVELRWENTGDLDTVAFALSRIEGTNEERIGTVGLSHFARGELTIRFPEEDSSSVAPTQYQISTVDRSGSISDAVSCTLPVHPRVRKVKQ